MSLWSRSLGWRLAIAFACSVASIGVLAVVVDRMDAPPKPTKRARSASGSDQAGPRAAQAGVVPASVATAKDSADQLARLSPSAPATLQRALGFRLLPSTGTIVLTHRESSLAPDIVPVVEVLPGGGVVLRRPMPISAGPGAVAPLSQAGHGAGVILPVTKLSSLSPAARATLIGLLQQWLIERPVLPSKLVSADLVLAPDEIRRLLSWVP